MSTRRIIAAAATTLCLLGVFLLATTTANTIATTAPAAAGMDREAITQLQKQVDELRRQLSQINTAATPLAKQQAMQQHWRAMLDHMRALRAMPSMRSGSCSHWQMIDSAYSGAEPTLPGLSPNCPLIGHGMPMGQGTGQGMLDVPAEVLPDAYQLQMHGHMQTMRNRITAIATETDPARRQVLLREHYDAVYRDMQTMRGLGWMWQPTANAALPDPSSKGARLVANFCSQCHAAPSPSLHNNQEWADVIARMRAHISDRVSASAIGVRVPRAADLDAIERYLRQHAGDHRLISR